jgi:hypothetical protein
MQLGKDHLAWIHILGSVSFCEVQDQASIMSHGLGPVQALQISYIPSRGWGMVKIQFSAHPVLLEGQRVRWSVMTVAKDSDSTLISSREIR